MRAAGRQPALGWYWELFACTSGAHARPRPPGDESSGGCPDLAEADAPAVLGVPDDCVESWTDGGRGICLECVEVESGNFGWILSSGARRVAERAEYAV